VTIVQSTEGGVSLPWAISEWDDGEGGVGDNGDNGERGCGKKPGSFWEFNVHVS